MKIITTISKEKLPKEFSYPLGAEKISQALQGVPQFGDMTLYFRWRDEFLASKYKVRLAAGGSINILHLYHTMRWENWSIAVSALPAQHCQSAREQLLPAALEALKQSLITAGTESEYFQWNAHYNLATQTLHFGSSFSV